MVPLPTVLGLIVCEKAIVEEGTKNVSLLSTFERLNVERVPSTPRPFVIFATLTDGQGDGTISVVVTHLETDEVVRVFRGPIHFPNRLTEVRILFRVNGLSFPVPGFHFRCRVDTW